MAATAVAVSFRSLPLNKVVACIPTDHSLVWLGASRAVWNVRSWHMRAHCSSIWQIVCGSCDSSRSRGEQLAAVLELAGVQQSFGRCRRVRLLYLQTGVALGIYGAEFRSVCSRTT